MIADAEAGASDPPPVLVRAFLDASIEALDFLAGRPDFRSTTTVEQLSDRGIVPVVPDAVTGFFWARRQFSTAHLKGEMMYGERELEVNLVVGPVPIPRGATGPYAFWEWVAVLGSAADWDSGGSSSGTAGRVRAVVVALGAALRTYAPRIAAAGPDVIRRLEDARARRQAEWKAQEAARDHQTVSARAAEAFRVGDYRRVVTLLEPLRHRLTPAEQKKLEIARKRL